MAGWENAVQAFPAAAQLVTIKAELDVSPGATNHGSEEAHWLLQALNVIVKRESYVGRKAMCQIKANSYQERFSGSVCGLLNLWSPKQVHVHQGVHKTVHWGVKKCRFVLLINFKTLFISSLPYRCYFFCMFYKLYNMLGWWYLEKVGWMSQIFSPWYCLQLQKFGDYCGKPQICMLHVKQLWWTVLHLILGLRNMWATWPEAEPW